MHPFSRQFANTIGWHFPLKRTLARRDPVILVYHGVPRRDALITGDVFERHVRFLLDHFDLVGARDLGEKRRRLSRLTVLLTFDDGFSNHAEVVAPILARYGVPAIFFVPSRHADPGRYLWFVYLRLIEKYFPGNGFRFGGQFWDMSEKSRSETVARLRRQLLELTPHPAAMYKAIEAELPRAEDFVSQEDLRDRAAGMTAEQVAELARNPLFTIGVHTVDHPFLTLCEKQEALHQIEENRRWLEKVSGQPTNLIAYPVSDFDTSVLQQCRNLGFQWGLSVERKIQGDIRLQLPRIGVYFPSLTELGCKVRWGRGITALKRLAPSMSVSSPFSSTTAAPRPV